MTLERETTYPSIYLLPLSCLSALTLMLVFYELLKNGRFRFLNNSFSKLFINYLLNYLCDLISAGGKCRPWNVWCIRRTILVGDFYTQIRVLGV